MYIALSIIGQHLDDESEDETFRLLDRIRDECSMVVKRICGSKPWDVATTVIPVNSILTVKVGFDEEPSTKNSSVRAQFEEAAKNIKVIYPRDSSQPPHHFRGRTPSTEGQGRPLAPRRTRPVKTPGDV